MNIFNLTLRDGPGKMPIGRMQNLFERSVNDTPALQQKVSLLIVTENGEFSHYADPHTDALWVGFALGLRCAERLANAQ
jgi:hypothetical protein